MVTRPYGEWKCDPDKIHITPGAVAITSGVWPDPVTSVEPVYYGVGSSLLALLSTYQMHGAQKHPTLAWLKELIQHPTEVLGFDDLRRWSERTAIMLCMQTSDTSIELYWDGLILRSRRGAGTPPNVHIPVVEEFVDRLAKKMGSSEAATIAEVINRTATAHFTGGIPIGDSGESGAVDPYQRVFGQPGLHVVDGSVMPANPGVNPSLTIAALAERAMSLWPNKGEADTRPSLGSGYERVDPVMPRHPVVPVGAPASCGSTRRSPKSFPNSRTRPGR
jgi:cholesterol oxidase